VSSRLARPSDVDEICAALPDTELGTSWGDTPTWKVPAGPQGKGFVVYRKPGPTAVDPDTGERYDDLLVISTPTEVEKAALVEDPTTPFFTIDHFKGYSAVLVQQSRDELAEIITDAWAKVAPKRLVREHLESGSEGG
jgi:hypothetical protein